MEEIKVGQKIYISHVCGCKTFTPIWAHNRFGIVLRINKQSFTIDVMDGGAPIRVDVRDIHLRPPDKKSIKDRRVTLFLDENKEDIIFAYKKKDISTMKKYTISLHYPNGDMEDDIYLILIPDNIDVSTYDLKQLLYQSLEQAHEDWDEQDRLELGSLTMLKMEKKLNHMGGHLDKNINSTIVIDIQ